MKNNMSPRFDIQNFNEFTYAKRSHWELFKGLDIELYGEEADPDSDALKRYQDLFVLLFIRTYVPKGSRILEVGGGNSRILTHLKSEYECWNVDKFEGVGNGPIVPDNAGYRLVRDYMGNFSPELSNNYFDFVFSISALEHVPRNDSNFHKNVVDDINRVLKPGNYSLHLLDFVVNESDKRQNPFIEFCFEYSNAINSYVPAEQALLDHDFYYMSEFGYNKYWQRITKINYSDFGYPSSYTILWKKNEKLISLSSLSNQLKTGVASNFESLSVVASGSIDDSFFKKLSNSYNAIQQTIKKNPIESANFSLLSVIENARISVHWNFDEITQVVDLNSSGILDVQQVSDPESSSITLDGRLSIDTFYIVTPSLNSVKYIDRTIQSVVMQEGDFHIRYHVQDSCSTDGTVEKLEKWSVILNNSDNNFLNCKSVIFSWDSSPDNGMYDAISKGIAAMCVPSDGVMAWINSDDTFLPGSFSTVYDIMRNNDDAFWVVGAMNIGGENGQEIGFNPTQYPVEVIREGLCDGEHWAFIQQEGTFWMGALWNHVGGVNTSLRLCGDWDLWRRFAMHTSPVHVLWGLGRFRKRFGQQTAQIDNYFDEINQLVPRAVRDRACQRISKTAVKKIRVVTSDGYNHGYKFRTIMLSRRLTRPISRNPGYAETFHKRVDDASQDLRINPKILTFCALDRGGAGTGSLRRIAALRGLGIDARLMTFVSQNLEVPTGRIEPALDGLKTTDQLGVWHCVHRNVALPLMRHPDFVGHELFSSIEAAITFHQLQPLIGTNDVVHLHWVVGMLDYGTISDVMKGRPFVWTLADMNAFTGGCHYSEGCDGFIRECRNCPQFSGKSDIPHEIWKRKQAAYKDLDIYFICPSNYIAELARRSSLIKDKKIFVIPNAYPVDIFKPADKVQAREILGLPQGKKLILFGADSVNNLRKGGDILKRSMDHLKTIHPLLEVEAVFFGKGKLELSVPCHSMGSSSSDKLALIYSAVDLFVSPSREDVGPMTVCESLLCGTPVVGFPVGILPELGTHKSTAYFARKFDHVDLAAGIIWALEIVDSDSTLVERCRAQAVDYADPNKCAERHKYVYERILGVSICPSDPLPPIILNTGETHRQGKEKHAQIFKTNNHVDKSSLVNNGLNLNFTRHNFLCHALYSVKIKAIIEACAIGDFLKAKDLFLQLKIDCQNTNPKTMPNLFSVLNYFDRLFEKKLG